MSKDGKKPLFDPKSLIEAQQALFITDSNSVILHVNEAFTKLNGYSAKDAVGQTPFLFSSGRHDADFYTAMRNQVINTGAWQGEIWNRRKNGEDYPAWLTITAIKDTDGIARHLLATLTDISAQKKTSE